MPERQLRSGHYLHVQAFTADDGDTVVHYADDADLTVGLQRGGLIVRRDAEEGAVILVRLNVDGERYGVVTVDGGHRQRADALSEAARHLDLAASRLREAEEPLDEVQRNAFELGREAEREGL